MKTPWVLPLTMVVSMALVGVMNIRKKEHDKEDKQNMLSNIKLRVTDDVLGEYQSEKSRTQNLLDKKQGDLKALEEDVNICQNKADKAKDLVDICHGGQKTTSDELATAETEFNNLKAETDKEKTSWRAEVETLKRQLAAQSSVCGFLKTGSDAASQLCGNKVNVEDPKQEEPKAEVPKQEEPKAEVPKQEEPTAEDPKKDKPNAESPKEKEPKAEAPKEEESKAEAPKEEESKAEAPK